MAAEKVNTRQKMINMMYLVFIAMLALNISKEVLGTLGILSEDMEKSTAELKSSIDDLYTTIDLNSNQDYYKIPSEELPKLRDLTDDYWSYIQMLKDSLISLDKNNYLTNVSVKNEDGEKTEVTMVDYQIMDKSVDLDELFFKGDGNSEKGAEFVSYFSSFKTNVTAVLDSIISRDERTIKSNYSFASAISNLESRFNYSEDVLNSDGNYQPWLEYNYQGFPLIASLSKFTKIQSDIRAVEYEILNSLTSKTKDRKLSLDNTDTLLETTQSAYYTNSTVDAAVVVGRTDSSFKPDVVDLKIDGVDLKESEFSIVNGKIVLDKRFSSPGIKNITGFLIFKADGEIDSLGVDQKFYVINKPNDAIVSPLNMQVFYIGLRNEIKVAFPGIADLSSIRVNGKNGSILKNGSRYFAAPNAGVSSMDVIVSGRANNETLTSQLRKKKYISNIQHIALRTDDIFKLSKKFNELGLKTLKISDNYYDDIDAKFGLETNILKKIKENNILYDEDSDGSFFQIYTTLINNSFFLEFVQRNKSYDGYGANNAIFRISAQKKLIYGCHT